MIGVGNKYYTTCWSNVNERVSRQMVAGVTTKDRVDVFLSKYRSEMPF